ncbi:MAG: hypothetical protein QXM12_02855 [Nitrososphaerota archaeon]
MGKKRKNRKLMEQYATTAIGGGTQQIPLDVQRKEIREKLSKLAALYQLGVEEEIPLAEEIREQYGEEEEILEAVLLHKDKGVTDKLARLKSELLFKYTIDQLRGKGKN